VGWSPGEDTSEEDDCGEYDTEVEVICRVIDDVDKETEEGTTPEKEGETADHMSKELAVPWCDLRRGKGVDAEEATHFLDASHGLDTLLGVRLVHLADVRNRHDVLVDGLTTL